MGGEGEPPRLFSAEVELADGMHRAILSREPA
jgi:hypothetical protein